MEKYLLSNLINNLDDSYEIYFQLNLNSDKSDIVIVRKVSGVLIIEVKDWNLDHYYCDNRGNFILSSNQRISVTFTFTGIGPSPIA